MAADEVPDAGLGHHLTPLFIASERQASRVGPLPTVPDTPPVNPHALDFDVVNEIAKGGGQGADLLNGGAAAPPRRATPSHSRKTVAEVAPIAAESRPPWGLLSIGALVILIAGAIYWSGDGPRQPGEHPAQKCKVTCSRQIKERHASGDVEANEMDEMSACISKCLRPKSKTDDATDASEQDE